MKTYGHLSRRNLLFGAGALLAVSRTASAVSTHGRAAKPLPPPLPPEVFRERQKKLRSEARERGLTAVFVTPCTNLRYAANITMDRSERLTALLLLVDGPAAVLTPYFEKPRCEKEGVFDEIQTWHESENPIALCASLLPAKGRIGVEGTTAYHTALALREAVGGEVFDFTDPFDALRSVKSAQEQAFIVDAAARTVEAIEATFLRLRAGMTEKEGSRILSEEFARQGTPSGGLVQFGASSALPHGGPGERRLAKGDVVLIDTGCSVNGYTSDVTRTASYGAPSDEVKRVYDLVDRAQRAGIGALRAGAACEAVDAAARRVIEEAGYGAYFTHRLGHGLGMDGHETPYLVEGNRKPLVPGNVETIEPGIYLPGRFGVRIEDDFAVTSGEARALSPRPAPFRVL